MSTGRSAALCLLVASGFGCASILGLEESTLIDAGPEVVADSAIDAATDSAIDAATDSAIDSVADTTTVDAPADTLETSLPSVTVFLAAPDQASSYVCVVTFATTGMPDEGWGPYGSDNSVPAGSRVGLSYPSTFPLPSEALHAFDAKRAAVMVLETNPASLPGGCKEAWKTAMTTSRSIVFEAGTVKASDALALAFTGCSGAGSADGECGPSGANLELASIPLDTGSSAAGKLSVQVLNLARYDTTATGPVPPSLKTVKVNLRAFTGTSAAPDVELASSVTYKAHSPPVQITPPTGDKLFLLLTRPTESPCAFVPMTTPPTCGMVPIELGNPLTEAKSHDPSIALAGGQSLVIAFAGTSRGMPPAAVGMIGRIR